MNVYRVDVKNIFGPTSLSLKKAFKDNSFL